MRRAIRALAIACVLGACRHAAPVLTRAHAHNDYEHARPLLDALDHRFGSIEADVWLVDGRLLVAHDRKDVRTDRTLERLYLDPLRTVIEHDGSRRWPTDVPRVLLIDIKSDADSTYAVLDPLLRRYADLFTAYDGDHVTRRPLLAILSGNRPIATVRTATHRIVALDGRLADLSPDSSPPPPAVMPLISQGWDAITKWDGAGNAPDFVRAAVTDAVRRSHAQGRRLRFWGSPDDEAVWGLLYDAGVDLLNADDLNGLERFLDRRGSRH